MDFALAVNLGNLTVGGKYPGADRENGDGIVGGKGGGIHGKILLRLGLWDGTVVKPSYHGKEKTKAGAFRHFGHGKENSGGLLLGGAVIPLNFRA